MTPRDAIADALCDVLIHDHPWAEAGILLEKLKAAGFAIVPIEPDEVIIRAVDAALHEHWPNARRMATAMHHAIVTAAESEVSSP